MSAFAAERTLTFGASLCGSVSDVRDSASVHAPTSLPGWAARRASAASRTTSGSTRVRYHSESMALNTFETQKVVRKLKKLQCVANV